MDVILIDRHNREVFRGQLPHSEAPPNPVERMGTVYLLVRVEEDMATYREDLDQAKWR